MEQQVDNTSSITRCAVGSLRYRMIRKVNICIAKWMWEPHDIDSWLAKRLKSDQYHCGVAQAFDEYLGDVYLDKRRHARLRYLGHVFEALVIARLFHLAIYLVMMMVLTGDRR